MKQFDYVIIGAGSAGCVLANRLTENPSNEVLLLEAGKKDNKLEIHIPGAYGFLNRSNVDWGFETETQKNVNNRKIYLPRGKTLGGSSSTNAMAYVRGNKEDYNEWEKLGNKGWGYNEILKYFIKSEHNENINNKYHGKNGPLHVGFAESFKTPYANAFVNACKEKGIKENLDYNGEEQLGAGLFQFNIKKGIRQSASTAFLKPCINRKNLKIITGAHVNKILIENDKAVGVEFYVSKNNTQNVKIKKEVILSAGSFQSPQILMLSGIGDKNELKSKGIKLKKELNGVGKNLQDHLFFPISSLGHKFEGVNHHFKLQNQFLGLMKWIFTRKGVFTISPLEANAFVKLNTTKNEIMQFHFVPLVVGDVGEADIYNPKTYPLIDGYTILPSLLKPKSVGSVSIKSSNPFDKPIIQPNFLSKEEDLKNLVTGAKFALQLAQASSFNNYGKQMYPNINTTDSNLAEYIKNTLETIYHPIGTCKMGKDEAAVVNEKLQVKGIENLRVVDASIMPTIISGNTNAPVYMIAEKASDMILQN